jgi:hypothetical protein
MAYKQKSKDISGLMMKMKSPLNYGGRSAMMKTGDPVKSIPEPTKPDPYNFKYKGVNYSMGEGGQINLPGGKSFFKNDRYYGDAQKRYNSAYQMAMGGYQTKLDAYNKQQSASKVKTKPDTGK